MTDQVRIIADHREEPGGVIEELRLMKKVQVEVHPLLLGDYHVLPHLLVERKTLVDLAASLKDGPLFSQARRLSAGPHRAALILEGRGRDLIGSQMRREALLGAIISLCLVCDLPVLRSSNPAETARMLVYAGRQLQHHAKDIPVRHGKRPRRKRRVQLGLLQGFPGVGAKKAQALLDRFGSVRAVVGATREELTDVAGLGPSLAETILWALDE